MRQHSCVLFFERAQGSKPAIDPGASRKGKKKRQPAARWGADDGWTGRNQPVRTAARARARVSTDCEQRIISDGPNRIVIVRKLSAIAWWSIESAFYLHWLCSVWLYFRQYKPQLKSLKRKELIKHLQLCASFRLSAIAN